VVLNHVIAWLETIGGARPARVRSAVGWMVLGLWWAVLFGLAYAAIGRGTKFIYVDF
jgi:hypothetical protein